MERQSSPSSCWSRCDVNSSIVAAQRGWEEGACDCTPSCLLGFGVACCEDYIGECSYHKIEPRREIWFWIKWSGPIGIALVVFVVIGFFVIAARWRVVTPVRKEGEEDIVQMIDEDDEREFYSYNTGLNHEEVIDFSLATQCPLEASITGENTKAPQTTDI